MKTKPLLFAFGLCVLLLSGCVATAGPDYVYYPPAPVYYAPVRPYYFHPRRPIVVVPRPYHRPPYRSPHHGYYQNRGNGYRQEGNGYNGNYDPRTHGHSRRRADQR
jgi:hypothetical protein